MKTFKIHLAALVTLLSLTAFKTGADEYNQENLVKTVGWLGGKYHCSGMCKEHRPWHNYVSGGLWHPETLFSVSGSGDTPGEARADMRDDCDGTLYDVSCD